MLAWDEANIRSQDYLTVVQQISRNPSGAALVWDDVRSRWPQLVNRFTLNSRYLGGLIPVITSSFDTELKLKEVWKIIFRNIFGIQISNLCFVNLKIYTKKVCKNS